MDWHYATADNQKERATEEQLKALFEQGSINSQTLVWNETMSDWAPYSQVLSNAPSVTQPTNQSVAHRWPTGPSMQ